MLESAKRSFRVGLSTLRCRGFDSKCQRIEEGGRGAGGEKRSASLLPGIKGCRPYQVPMRRTAPVVMRTASCA
jgi:hypothetical protein